MLIWLVWSFSKINLFIFAALGLHRGTWAFSNRIVWRLLSSCDAWAFHCGGFSCCGTWAPECIDFSSYSVRAQLPQDMCNLRSRTRDQTHVPCIGRHIYNHWTTRQVQLVVCSLKAFIGCLISNIGTHSHHCGPYSEGFSWERTSDLLSFFFFFLPLFESLTAAWYFPDGKIIRLQCRRPWFNSCWEDLLEKR